MLRLRSSVARLTAPLLTTTRFSTPCVAPSVVVLRFSPSTPSGTTSCMYDLDNCLRWCSTEPVKSSVRDVVQRFRRASVVSDLCTTSTANRQRDVFCNNEVNMNKIKVIGLDFDYTVAVYKPALPELVYSLARNFLVKELRYPSMFGKTATYDPTFATRGLSYDTRKGVLVKMNSAGSIASGRSVFRGRKRLSREEVYDMYDGSLHIPREYRNEHMKPLVDLFSLPQACLIADIVQYFVDTEVEFSNDALAEDIARAISYVHTSGKMHNTVAANPKKYFDPDPHLQTFLEQTRKSGKQLFLLTNSSFSYIDAGLKYLLGSEWESFFDVVICDSMKPLFYSSRRPFREVDKTRGRNKWSAVTEFVQGRVYSQGNAFDLMKFMNWKGNEVLYYGDNVLSDNVVASKTHGWYGGMILRELENHMRIHDSEVIISIDAKIACLEALMRLVQIPAVRILTDDSEVHVEEQVEETEPDPELLAILRQFLADRSLFAPDSHPHDSSSLTTVPEILDALHKERYAFRSYKQSFFHKNFGSEFSHGALPTLFAFTVMRYVDLYTSRLSNSLAFPHDYRFYPQPKLLPHQHPQSSPISTDVIDEMETELVP